MKRALTVTALLAMGLLVASSFAAAQDKPASTAGGQVTLGLLGRNDVSSSKFTEYREVPKGVSIPYLNLFATSEQLDFNLLADNVRQTDQRYTGWRHLAGSASAFDYNQTPHNMGNNAHADLVNETAPGVWSMSADAARRRSATRPTRRCRPRRAPTTSTTALLAPTFADANSVDISSLRERGDRRRSTSARSCRST